MVDTYLYAFGLIMTGTILGVIIPYLFKCMDNEMTFSYSYLYAMIISMSVTAAGMVPETINITDGRVAMSLIFAGIGIQSLANMVTSKIRKNVAKSATEQE